MEKTTLTYWAIRPASNEDVVALNAILAQDIRGCFRFWGREFRLLGSADFENSHQVYTLCYKGEAVGFSRVRFDGIDDYAFVTIYIRPERRYGFISLQAIVFILRYLFTAQDMRRVEFLGFSNNPKSRFYRRIFRCEGVRIAAMQVEGTFYDVEFFAMDRSEFGDWYRNFGAAIIERKAPLII